MPKTISNDAGAPVLAAPDSVPDVALPTVPSSAVLGTEVTSGRDFLDSKAKEIATRQPKSTVPVVSRNQRDRDPSTGKFKPVPKTEGAPADPDSATAPDPDPAPAKPAAPAKAPAPTPAPAPAAPAKIKVANKEYSPEELEDLVKKATSPAPAPEPAKPAPEPPKPSAPAPSKEEIEKAEAKYIEELASGHAPGLTDKEVDEILVGGAEGAAKLNTALARVAARAQFATEKRIFNEVAPEFKKIYEAINPVLQQTQQLERVAVEQMFVRDHPDFANHLEQARAVGEMLTTQYPEWVSKATHKQFVDEVARQTDRLLEAEFKRWNPNFQGTWKDYAKAQSAPPAAPAVPSAVVPTPAPQPPKPAIRKAPPSNAPGGGVPAPTPGVNDFQKLVANSLMD